MGSKHLGGRTIKFDDFIVGPFLAFGFIENTWTELVDILFWSILGNR